MLQRYSTDSACAQLQHVKIGEKHAVCEIFMNLWSRELMYHHYSYIFNLEHSPVIKRYLPEREREEEVYPLEGKMEEEEVYPLEVAREEEV